MRFDPFIIENIRKWILIGAGCTISNIYQAERDLLNFEIAFRTPNELIGESTYADAIMDRLLHHSQRIELSGESMRKMTENLTYADHLG